MPCSPARLAANRRNAARSTGPRTAEGKARSRANAYKHGMTGEGVVGPVPEPPPIRPEVVDPALARRIAVLADRLDRLARHERAAVARCVAEAAANLVERRHREADDWVEFLPDRPREAVRNLLRTPEGCDRLIGLWRDLADDQARGSCWGDAHRDRAENLLGRRADDLGLSRARVLEAASRGIDLLSPPGVRASDPEAGSRKLEARAAFAAFLKEQIEALEAHKASLPPIDLAGAADLALFDTSEQAGLFRRYELATERGLYRALREREKSASPASTADKPGPVGSVGSFGAEAVGEPIEPDQPLPPPIEPDPSPEAVDEDEDDQFALTRAIASEWVEALRAGRRPSFDLDPGFESSTEVGSAHPTRPSTLK